MGRAARYWIVAGTNNNEATLVSLNTCRPFQSKLSIRINVSTSGNYLPPYCVIIKTAVSSGNSAALIVSEESGYCHLVSMNSMGKLALMQTILPTDGLPDGMIVYDTTISSMPTDKGDVLVCCHQHVKRLTVAFN